MYTFFKILSSAAIIGVVTEVARRFPTYGGIIAALPLVSILSIIWLTVQSESRRYRWLACNDEHAICDLHGDEILRTYCTSYWSWCAVLGCIFRHTKSDCRGFSYFHLRRSL